MSHNVGVVFDREHIYNAHGGRWYKNMVGKLSNYQKNLYFLDKALPYQESL